ncbi:MAG: hypothetical protein AAB888_00475 [Patescibacteria group bacterium]
MKNFKNAMPVMGGYSGYGMMGGGLYGFDWVHWVTIALIWALLIAGIVALGKYIHKD